jgi:hypothetical protein
MSPIAAKLHSSQIAEALALIAEILVPDGRGPGAGVGRLLAALDTQP